jgi:ABC-type spermidine/putrescine transport system permease subunit I
MKTKKFSMRLFVFLLIALCLVIYFIFLNNVKVSDKRPGVAYVNYTRVLNESSIMQQEKRKGHSAGSGSREKRATEEFSPA